MNEGIRLSLTILAILIFGGISLNLLIGLFIVPIVSTPRKLVKRIVEKMELKDGEAICDLGSGDGRILIAARKDKKIKGVGYDISPLMIIYSDFKKFINFGFRSEIDFDLENFFDVKLDKFDKLYCFLSPNILGVMKEKFDKKLKRGAIVYSYGYEIPGKKAIGNHEFQPGRTLWVYKW